MVERRLAVAPPSPVATASLLSTMAGQEVALHEPNERQFPAVCRAFCTKEEEADGVWNDLVNVRVFLPPNVNEDNSSATTEFAVVNDGFALEVKVMMPDGLASVGTFCDRHKANAETKLMQIAMDDPKREALFDECLANVASIDKVKAAEQAVIDEEQDLCKDNHLWGAFRLPLDKQVEEEICNIDCQVGDNGVDAILTKLKIVKADEHVKKKGVASHKRVKSPS